jgi:hypothetical protein
MGPSGTCDCYQASDSEEASTSAPRRSGMTSQRPYSDRGLDEPLGLVVCAECGRHAANRFEIPDPAGLAAVPGAIGQPVLRVDMTAGDSLMAVSAHCTGREADRRRILLIGQHLHVGQMSCVIQPHMDTLS